MIIAWDRIEDGRAERISVGAKNQAMAAYSAAGATAIKLADPTGAERVFVKKRTITFVPVPYAHDGRIVTKDGFCGTITGSGGKYGSIKRVWWDDQQDGYVLVADLDTTWSYEI